METYKEFRHVRTGREKMLKEIADEVAVCRRCPLWEGTCKSVPGEGDSGAEVIFIGEAPGRTEDRTGRPFVGRSGAVLDRLLSGISLDRERVFITNLVKHHPCGNRPPKKEEIFACAPYLQRQLSIIRPFLLVALGRLPASVLLPSSVRTAKGEEVRGRIFATEWEGVNVHVMATYHPASALRNPRHLKAMEDDFQFLHEMFDNERNRL